MQAAKNDVSNYHILVERIKVIAQGKKTLEYPEYSFPKNNAGPKKIRKQFPSNVLNQNECGIISNFFP